MWEQTNDCPKQVKIFEISRKFKNIYFPDDDITQPLPDLVPANARFQPSPPTLNLLNPALAPIGQPYSADMCSYGPVYHSHMTHGYNPAYGPDKIRPTHLTRPMYQYQSYYGPGNMGLRQNTGSYEFGQR